MNRPDRRDPRLRKNRIMQRHIVIGDIHGCFAELEARLSPRSRANLGTAPVNARTWSAELHDVYG
jgi:hypothetical protein